MDVPDIAVVSTPFFGERILVPGTQMSMHLP
jgi:hypothetical protein